MNDTYGHSTGDEVLRQFASILQKSVRKEDTVSRNGGEEFSVIMAKTTSTEAFEIAERIRKNVMDQRIQLADGTILSITVSIGIATYPENVEDGFKLYHEADKALYQAKAQGRNCTMVAG
nr:GGDEF domain-containing protein [Ammoniphilus sp. YIM 78166]